MTRRSLRIALVTLGSPHTLTGGYLYHLRLAELAHEQDASLEFISVPTRPFPLAVLDGPRALRQAERLSVDAIVVDSIAAAYLGPALQLRGPRLRPPIIGMLHQPPGGIDHAQPHSTVQAVLDLLAYRNARRLLLASETLADDLVGRGIPGDRLRFVPPGRDVADSIVQSGPSCHDHASLDRNRQGRQVALLCVGNWVPHKGILDLLEAVARLAENAATLHLVGDTRTDPAYAARVRARLGAADLVGRVVVHGPLPREEVAALYGATDVFALLSLKEPYGTVYGEAMAFGLPVVGWRAGNLPHLAEHEREGLVFEPGDLDGLSKGLARLAQDARLREQMGRAARQRALTRPTWQESAGLFFGAIREVVEDR